METFDNQNSTNEQGRQHQQCSETNFAGKVGTPLEKCDELLEALTIPERSLAAEPGRVVGYERKFDMWYQRNEFVGPFISYDDFYERGVDRVPTEVRDYKISGHEMHIIVPERYASLLESGHLDEEHARRLTVQDLPALLDTMPDSRYFSRLCMSDNRNPEDYWVSQGESREDFVSAMSMIEKELTTYRTHRSKHLRRDFLHEWSHELRYEFWDTDITDLFKQAVAIEQDWLPRPYAARNNGEQWAVLGERMLGNCAQDFLEAVEKAPIRVIIWMRALKSCLDNLSPENHSVDHEIYLARQKYVEEVGTAIAAQKLLSLLQSGTSDEIQWSHSILRSFEYSV